jgi:hypothetical protein
MKTLSLALVAGFSLACAGTASLAAPGAAPGPALLAPLPDWAQDTLYSGPYLDIEKTMQAEKLSRFEAVELQNRMRDRIDAKPGLEPQKAYDEALAEIRQGRFESGWKPLEFKEPGDFVVALDMDETLLMQWQSPAGGSDLTISADAVKALRSGTGVKFTPGAEAFLKGLRKIPHCKAVVAFSAKADAPALEIVQKWKFASGEPARNYIDAVFTRNHLVLGPKALLPSKDLRILDPELKHVVLVDDNPGRVMQTQLLLAEPKFDADAYARAGRDGNAEVRKHYETLLGSALEELQESSLAATRMKIPFSQAFLPYSYSGERIYLTHLRTGATRPKALEFTRLHPELQEAAFVPVH